MMPEQLTERKKAARNKKFLACSEETGISYCCRWNEIQEQMAKIREKALSVIESLNVETFTLPAGLFAHIFESACGIVIFFSDGLAFYAPRPLQIGVPFRDLSTGN